jgi:hypothetical protein
MDASKGYPPIVFYSDIADILLRGTMDSTTRRNTCNSKWIMRPASKPTTPINTVLNVFLPFGRRPFKPKIWKWSQMGHRSHHQNNIPGPAEFTLSLCRIETGENQSVTWKDAADSAGPTNSIPGVAVHPNRLRHSCLNFGIIVVCCAFSDLKGRDLSFDDRFH